MADQVTAEQLKLGMLFPPQSEVLEMAIHTTPRRKRIQWPCPCVNHIGLTLARLRQAVVHCRGGLGMHGREHDATVFADHVVVAGIADLFQHRLAMAVLD